MSEDRIIEARGERKMLFPELMRDTQGDELNLITEVEQVFAAVRQQLTELTVALRSDLEDLRRLVRDPPPIQGTTTLTASADSTRPRVDHKAAQSWRPREQDAADSGHVLDPRAGIEIERKFLVKELPAGLDRFPVRAHLAGLPRDRRGRARGARAPPRREHHVDGQEGARAHTPRGGDRRSSPSSSSACGR